MTDEPIDVETFSDLKDATGSDFVAELVRTFLDEAPGMLSALKAAAQASDTDGYRRAAHSIKSNAQTFGAIAVAEVARKIELGDLPAQGGPSDIAALEASLETAAQALRRLIDD